MTEFDHGPTPNRDAIGVLKLARTMALSTADVTASGFRLAAPEQVRERLDACKSCPYVLIIDTTIKCRICRCDMRIKARFFASRCAAADRDTNAGSRWKLST